MRLTILVLAVLFSSVHGTDLVFSDNKAYYCGVQVCPNFLGIKEQAVALVASNCREFDTCYTPRYVATRCHTYTIGGKVRSKCYTDMLFFCSVASKAYRQCKNIDISALIGMKIKLIKDEKAVITDAVVTKTQAQEGATV